MMGVEGLVQTGMSRFGWGAQMASCPVHSRGEHDPTREGAPIHWVVAPQKRDFLVPSTVYRGK